MNTVYQPPKPVKPLSSEELANEARKAGIETDDITFGADETHLPASESEQIEEKHAATTDDPENDVTKLPPG